MEFISSSCTCVGALVVNQLSPAVHRYYYYSNVKLSTGVILRLSDVTLCSPCDRHSQGLPHLSG